MMCVMCASLATRSISLISSKINSSCFVSAALFIDSSAVLITHLTRCSSFPDFRFRPLSQERHLSAGNSLDDVEAECCDTLRLFTELSPNCELVLGSFFLRFIIECMHSRDLSAIISIVTNFKHSRPPFR